MRTFKLEVVFDTPLNDEDLDKMLEGFYSELSTVGRIATANVEEIKIDEKVLAALRAKVSPPKAR